MSKDMNSTDNSTDNFFQRFDELTEEQWQEFAFDSVKDVQKLVRKNNSGMNLKPLYTQNDQDKLAHSDLLVGFSRLKTQALAFISDPTDYDQAISLNVKNCILKLNLKELHKAQFHDYGSQIQSCKQVNEVFVEFLQNPLLESRFWDKQLGNKIKRHFLYDPIVFSMEHSRRYDALDINKMDQKALCVDSSYFSNLGLNDLHELSHTLLLLDHYLKEVPDHERKSVFAKTPIRVSLGSAFFQNIAKLRALNLLLQRYFFSLFGEAYNKDGFFIIATGKQSDKLDIDLHTNILRETTANMSAQLGGVRYYQCSDFDNSHQAKRLALNTFSIIKEECFSQNVFDPAAGSYYLETLTDKYAQQAWLDFNKLKESTLETIERYFLEGEFYQVCLEDQKEYGEEFAIGKTSFINELESCLSRSTQELASDKYWDTYDLKKQKELEENKDLNFSNFAQFKELLGFSYENSKNKSLIKPKVYQKGDGHE